MKIVNPTGKPARGSDSQGSGAFGAPRDPLTHHNGSPVHNGLDLLCTPGQVVASPIRGFIRRRKVPYDSPVGAAYNDGVLIQGLGEHSAYTATMFYMTAAEGLIGKVLSPGDFIGVARDISERYPGISPHVHLGIEQAGEWIDPTPLIFGAPS